MPRELQYNALSRGLCGMQEVETNKDVEAASISNYYLTQNTFPKIVFTCALQKHARNLHFLN
jgi:hypothetical protein